MKFCLFITLAFSIALNLNAQEFAPEDAVWYYNYDPDITLDDGYRKIDVLGDTVINQYNCKILRTTDIGYNYFDKDYYEIPGDNIYIYEKDSIVYYFKSNEFYVLYDFTAKKGDTITSISYPENCKNTYELIIDSISYQYINQDSLRKYYFHINEDPESYFYIEKIGFPDYLLPTFSHGCENLTGPHYPGPLRCYYDNTIGYFNTGISPSCDYITGINETSRDYQIQVFPNPTQGPLEIHVPDNMIYTFELIDNYGRLLSVGSFQASVRIDISEYIIGVYFVKVRSNQTILGTYKILKL